MFYGENLIVSSRKKHLNQWVTLHVISALLTGNHILISCISLENKLRWRSLRIKNISTMLWDFHFSQEKPKTDKLMTPIHN